MYVWLDGEDVQLYVIIYDGIWFLLNMHDHVCSNTIICDYVWLAMHILDLIWLYNNLH